jgi:putative YhbY family RNA-binding protein
MANRLKSFRAINSRPEVYIMAEPAQPAAGPAQTDERELQLTPKERQTLKGRAHRLNPVVLLGNAGLSEPALKEIDRALNAHELIKIRVPMDDDAELAKLFADIATRLSAARVQTIGKVLVLYRPLPQGAATAASPHTLANAPHYTAPGGRPKPSQFSPRSAVMKKAGRSR